ncbi:MAG: YdeI/OmpD-associated family protein [Microthrixaceae bacterium]
MAPELEKLPFVDASAFRAWLEINYDTSAGLWLMIGKKSGGVESVTYDEAVDEALCFGWIDGQKAKLDDRYYLQRFTPRGKRSPWSKLNTARVARLSKAKRMHTAGVREVDAAKADGRWVAAYASQATAAVPHDLQAALDASPAAAALFAELDGRNRYAILYRIDRVRRPESRATKVASFVADLEHGKTPYPHKKQ